MSFNSPKFDPTNMALFLTLKRDWWISTAQRAKGQGQLQLEALALEVAALYDDAITRVREVEHRSERQLRDLFWRHRLWQSNN
ncbi:MAG: hypothetical protein ACRD3G_12075 [Vicinamibacterales bacterium]